MRYVPFVVIYANGNVIVSTIHTVFAGHISDVNTAITAANVAHPTFGIKTVPAVPTGSLAIHYEQGQAPSNLGSVSELVRTNDITSGFDNPCAALDSILNNALVIAQHLSFTSDYGEES